MPSNAKPTNTYFEYETETGKRFEFTQDTTTSSFGFLSIFQNAATPAKCWRDCIISKDQAIALGEALIQFGESR